MTKVQLAAKARREQSEQNSSALELTIAARQETVRTQKEAVEELIRETGKMLQETIANFPERKGETGAVPD